MGTLYYAEREDNGEVFAFNKLYTYADLGVAHELLDEFVELTPEIMEKIFHETDPGWRDRIFVRLRRWAAGTRIALRSEHDFDSYEEGKPHVTGSAYDDDHDPDGLTYKEGSAW